MIPFQLTAKEQQQFQEEGYFIIPQLLQEETLHLLKEIATADLEMQREAASRADGEGGAIKLNLKNDLYDNDLYSALVRSRSLVTAMEQLLGDEVYHYHNKMILKEPYEGGAWAWHQDYGYWYNFCCPFPLMASCMIAIDKATPENGCLQVIKGSHLMGRVEHLQVGEQTGADPERVEVALERLDLVHVELEPGSAVVFHSNLLHRSDQNKSENPRWAFICCYNAKKNNPYRQVRHPQYTPLDRINDNEVLEIGRTHWNQLQQTL